VFTAARVPAGGRAERRVEGGELVPDEVPERRTHHRPDHRVDGVPRRVEVRDLVGEHLEEEQHAGGDHHVGAPQGRRHARDLEEPLRDAEDEDHEVGVDAARPAGREDPGQEFGAHAGASSRMRMVPFH
jgi:hypothetical protein